MEIQPGFCECGCGNKTKKKGKTKFSRFISGHNSKGQFLHENHNWKGGSSLYLCGYIQKYVPDHPRAGTKGYVKNHILIAEKAFGKPLPKGAVVHHVNGTKDSGPLVICEDNAYHNLLHRREKALKACGHAHWRKCWICQKYDEPINLYIYIKDSHVMHKECRRLYDKERWQPGHGIQAELEKGPGQD